VRHVNFDNSTIRLDVGSTKNREGREVAMTDRIAELLRLATRGKEPEDRVLTQPNGRPVKDFRRAWKALTTGAGLGGLMVHDLRRSGAKALRRAGVPESVIMEIGGWKTESVFRRYAIVSATDRRDAMEKLEADRARMDAALQASKAPDLSPLPGGVAGKLQ
jgi:integrase